MNKNKKLILENKILKARLEELNKTIPILIYDKNPSVWEFAKKELFTKYSLTKSIYYHFNKKIISYVIDKIFLASLILIFRRIFGGKLNV